jgi:hypothetical protein
MQAVARNCRNQSLRCEGRKPKWPKPRGESTEAEHWDGPTRMSDEGPVMVATRTSPRGSGRSVLLRRWEKVSRGLLAEAGLKLPRCCCTQKVWW